MGLYNEEKNLEVDGENPEEETPETELEIDFRKRGGSISVLRGCNM